jgi:hypothetical protein
MRSILTIPKHLPKGDFAFEVLDSAYTASRSLLKATSNPIDIHLQ